MNGIQKKAPYFTAGEIALWAGSVSLIAASFWAFDGESGLTLAASIIGATSLIFNAKGNPFGQLLMVVFSVMYGVISYSFAYYGEMITYLGMTAPMALFALITWLRNPYAGNRAQVKVNHLSRGEIAAMSLLTVTVTILFGWVLWRFDTANLGWSTLSVTTSFAAVYLTFRRSAYFALAYAANDVVLIVLWVLASMQDSAYVSVVICFTVFLANDVYGFISWLAMEKRQHGAE